MVCPAVIGLGTGHEVAVAIFRLPETLPLDHGRFFGFLGWCAYGRRFRVATVDVATGSCALARGFAQFR